MQTREEKPAHCPGKLVQEGESGSGAGVAGSLPKHWERVKGKLSFSERKQGQKCGAGSQGREFKHSGGEICCEEGSPAFTFSAFRGPLEPQFSEDPSWQLLPQGPWHLPSGQVWPIQELKRKQPLLLSAASQQGCAFSRETTQIWLLRHT